MMTDRRDNPNSSSARSAILSNGDRLFADLQELSGIGGGERGISRLAFSPADIEGRRWLLGKIRDAGLRARMDQVANVFGRLERQRTTEMEVEAVEAVETGETPTGRLAARAPSAAPAVLIGSHLDTVPEGGMFDGALGVLAGLECVRTIREAGVGLRHPLEIVAFADEEGSRIGSGIFGSRAFADGISAEEWGRVAPVLRAAGLGGADWQPTPVPPPPVFVREDYLCYLELHIEQGGILDASREDLGVVQGIVCISSFSATFRGEANHAGTTPMDGRKDALLGASETILRIPETVKRLGSGSSVGTCGQVRVAPGAGNIIPGEVEISVEVRDLDEAVAGRITATLRDMAGEIASRRGLTLGLTGVSLTHGAVMDSRIQEAVQEAARSLGLRSRMMPSGAGHDAMVMAKHLPCGLIFVPSRGGISHSPNEHTSKEQCAAGANALLRTVLALDASM